MTEDAIKVQFILQKDRKMCYYILSVYKSWVVGHISESHFILA
jgi:hypothetical protein